MKKLKRFKNFRRVYQYRQTLNLPNFTSWQTCLGDPSIEIVDVNKSLHWLSKAELSQKEFEYKNKDYYIEKHNLEINSHTMTL